MAEPHRIIECPPLGDGGRSLLPAETAPLPFEGRIEKENLHDHSQDPREPYHLLLFHVTSDTAFPISQPRSQGFEETITVRIRIQEDFPHRIVSVSRFGRASRLDGFHVCVNRPSSLGAINLISALPSVKFPLHSHGGPDEMKKNRGAMWTQRSSRMQGSSHPFI